jgi:hypothetical protein
MAALVVACGASGAARAAEGPWARITEGAPLYASARPGAALTALKRVGVGELPEVKQLKSQLAGIDPLDPLVLSPTGIDPNAPAVASFMEPAGPGRWHHRVAVTLRDKSIFQSFLAGLGMTGQVSIQAVEPGSALAAAGVIGWAPLGNKAMAVVRATETEAILDVVNDSNKKPPTAAELVKRFPLAPKASFRAEHGARALFAAPDTAVVAYADGRALGPVLELLDKNVKRTKAEAAQCAREFGKTAPASFDDLGLALTVAPDEVRAELDWGSQPRAGGGPALGGLKLTPFDDHGYDVELLSKQAAAVVALFAASAQPFQALKRGGAFASTATLQAGLDRCGALAFGALVIRSWPQAIGAVAGKPPAPSGATDTFNQAVQAFGKLRNLVLVARDATDNLRSVRYVAGATLDAEAKPLIDGLLAIAGQGTPQPIAGRNPTVYSLGALLSGLTVAVEPLKSGPLTVTLADSNDTLGWSMRTLKPVGAAPPEGKTPLLRVAVDALAVAKMLPMMQLGERDTRTMTELLTRMRRLDADAVIDGDRLRVTFRSPVAPPSSSSSGR